MSDLFRRFIRPARKQSIFRAERTGASGVGRVFGGLMVCLVVTALLSSGRLVAMADRQEYGPDRDRWLAAAEGVDALSSQLRLDRPAGAINAALDRDEREPSEIVLGELAAAVPSTTTTTIPKDTSAVTALPTTTTSTAPPATAPPTTALPTTALPTTPAPLPILGDVTINDPLRIWTGGDSLGEYVGSEMLYRVADPELSSVELDFEISTGLARPDYFDWPARFSEIMQREERPNVVVFMVGGNDDQDLRVDGERVVIGTPEWQRAYRERVATMMDIAAFPDVQMLWINLPPMRDDRRDNIRIEINAALAAEAERRPWVRVVDIVDLFTGSGGGYDQFIDEPDDSATRKARANDGIHITRQASRWVADMVWEAVSSQWRFDHRTPATTVTTSSSLSTVPPASTQPTSTTTATEGS